MFRSNVKRRYCPKEFGGQEHKWKVQHNTETDVHYCTNCGYKEVFDKGKRRIQ